MNKNREAQTRCDLKPLDVKCEECGKYRYLTRRAAKAARKRTNASGSLSVYLCGDYWHIGHTPWAIKKGYAQRSNTVATFERSA